jgi:hypothetical protein
MPNLPNLPTGSLSNYISGSSSCNCKYLDVVDLTADNISCTTLTVNEVPISTTTDGALSVSSLNVDNVLTIDGKEVKKNSDGSLETVELTIANRDESKCDANGNGLPGENPNAGYNPFTVKGYTKYNSTAFHEKLFDYGDTLAQAFGITHQISNPYSVPQSNVFGGTTPCYTTMQLAHDFTAPYNGGLFSYYHITDGDYRNKMIVDTNSTLGSSSHSLVVMNPPGNVNVELNVLPNRVSNPSINVGKITNANFFIAGPVPSVGQMISIIATPSTLNVSYATITSVTVKSSASTHPAYDILYTSNISSILGDSTGVTSVYLHPTLTCSGTTVTVTYSSGPVVYVGQNVTVTNATPSTINATNTPIVSTNMGESTSRFTYTTGVSYTGTVTNARVSLDQSGNLGSVGIHTAIPRAAFDVKGNIIFRDRKTNRPLITTLTENTSESKINFLNTASSTNTKFIEYDCNANSMTLNNTTANLAFFNVNAGTNEVNYYNTIDNKKMFMYKNVSSTSTYSSWYANTNQETIRFNHNSGEWRLYNPNNGNIFVQMFGDSSQMGVGWSTKNPFLNGTLHLKPDSTTRFDGQVILRSNQVTTVFPGTWYSNLFVGIEPIAPVTTYDTLYTDVASQKVYLGDPIRMTPAYMCFYQNPTQVLGNNDYTPVVYQNIDTALDNRSTVGTGSTITNSSLSLTHSYVTGKFTLNGTTTRYYNVCATVLFANNTTGTRFIGVFIYDSTGTLIRFLGQNNTTPISGVTTCAMNQTVRLNTGMSFAVVAYQNSGGTLSTYSNVGTSTITTVQVSSL